jgi:selenocysteine-specific elongation factor
VALLDRQEAEPGAVVWAQIRLNADVALAKGDLFIVRSPSPSATLGGGTVIEPHPRRHRRHQPAVLERLGLLERGTPEEIFLEQLALREPADFQTVVRRSGLAADEARTVVEHLRSAGDIVVVEVADVEATRIVPTTLFASRSGWLRLTETVRGHLEGFHAAAPLRRGMPKEEVRTRLGLDTRAFGRVVARLAADGSVREVGPQLALPDFEVRLTPELQRRVDQLLADLTAAGLSPPSRHELESHYGVPPDATQLLIERGDLTDVAADLIYPRAVYDGVVAAIVAAIQAGGPISVAQVRDLTGTSRRYVLPLLAHLDARRVTRRIGDDRVLA